MGYGVVRIDVLRFRAGYSKRRLNQVLSVFYLSMFFVVLLFIRAPFMYLLFFVAMCSLFWLFWLSFQCLPSDWLEKLL